MNDITRRAFYDELVKFAETETKKVMIPVTVNVPAATETKEDKKKLRPVVNSALKDILAGLGAGAASSIFVAPLATVADIKGSNAQDAHSKFYKKTNKEIAKMIYEEGGKGKEGLARVLGGLKSFYHGQGLKTVKLAPQNAINFAIFSALRRFL